MERIERVIGGVLDNMHEVAVMVSTHLGFFVVVTCWYAA